MLNLLRTCKEIKSVITSEICTLNFILANILCKHLSIEGAGETPSSRTPANVIYADPPYRYAGEVALCIRLHLFLPRASQTCRNGRLTFKYTMTAYYHVLSCSSFIIILQFNLTRQVKLPWKQYQSLFEATRRGEVRYHYSSPLTYDAVLVSE